ncbi:LysR family transcriptional regulator [Pseudonocardia sp. NPDC049154]|uniref:LysR family transcriptional regulator n=1 Tax=Pseudonocardia sp. NPDC049154 TaxID=3155501 RepID=UPI0033C34487
MELRHLQAFTVVAEELHFGRAAARLRMSQPPLSQQIRRLEREVGTRLLDRHTRHVALTAAGTAFLAEARRALAAADEAVAAARRAASGETGTVRLGFAGSSSYRELQAIAHRFRALHPDATLALVTGHFSGELAEDLRQDLIDAALLRMPVDGTGLTVREIARNTLVLALPAGHRFAGDEAVDLAAIAGEPFIAYPSQRMAVLRGAIDAACQQAGFAPRVVQEAPDTHTLLSLVGAGVGVGLALDPAAELAVPGTVIRPLTTEHVCPLGLAWRTDNTNPVLAALLDAAG